MHPWEGKREQVTWISTFLHEDLLIEIFKRLPAKTLCRFRCISKGWNSLISSSFFINLHYRSTNSPATLRNGKLFLVVEDVRFLGPSSYFLHPAQEKCLGLAKSFPFRHGDAHGRLLTYFYFVGVVHGVVCFSRSPSESGMVLWNPAVHKYIAIPPIPCLDMERYAIGFGYNRSRNDFKVVRIRIPFNGLGNNNLSSVYSSHEGQWRMASFDISVRCTELAIVSTRGIFVDGAIYWLLRAGIDVHIMLRFDCEREEFTTRELPREIFTISLEHETRWGAELVVYGGMVSVVMERWLLKFGPGCEHWVDLWVMEEHGVTTTWNKLHTFVDRFESVGTDWRSCHKLNGRMRLNRSKIYACNTCRKHSELMNRHLYEESMFLMDDPNTKSYAKNELVVLPR